MSGRVNVVWQELGGREQAERQLGQGGGEHLGAMIHAFHELPSKSVRSSSSRLSLVHELQQQESAVGGGAAEEAGEWRSERKSACWRRRTSRVGTDEEGCKKLIKSR